MKKIKWLSLILGISVMLTACSNSSGGGSGSGGGDDNGSYNLKTTEPSERDQLLTIADTIDIELDKEYDASAYKGKKAFLVVTNLSDETKDVYKQQSSSVNSYNARNDSFVEDTFFNEGKYINIPYNPPEVKRPVEPVSGLNANKINKNEFLYKNTRAALGDTKDFYAIAEDQVNISTEIAKGAVLKAIGEHCNVWYVAKKGISIKDSAFETLSKTFDDIFEYETYIFGSNIPTRTYPGTIISVDEETKVNIIVYDIFGDYLTTKKNGGGTFGYFSSTDFWVNPEGGTYGSNECEALHIDSYFLEVAPDAIRSTIAHEFQHLLHFVNKSVNQETVDWYKDDGTYGGKTFQSSKTWFNEMMSMVCEDIMQKPLGLKDEDSPKSRLPTFNFNYEAGFTTWRENTDKAPTAVMISYANAYTFGAYLIRNFGFDFIRDLATSKYLDKEAVTESLKKYSKDDDVKSFDEALSKYYYVVLNPKADKYTLNKSVSQTYTDVGGNKTVTFECSEINLYEYITLPKEYMNSKYDFLSVFYDAKENTDYCGPYIYNKRYRLELDPTGMSISYAGVITEDTYKLPSQYFNNDENLTYKVVFVE